jgi:3',5'-cyclic AMP phosphodiesterase CpdA
VLTRILHVSDLHVGAPKAATAELTLGPLVERFTPELVIVSGDLCHRGTAEQHETAAGLLRALGPSLLVVPGNHDIPYTFPARFTRTYAEFERQWETTEPVYSSESIVAVGLNSVRPWRNQAGGLSDSQLLRAAQILSAVEGRQLRVAALHHHLIGAPWRSRKRPVARRNHVLGSLVDAGAELIVAGHIHQSTVAERREFEIATGGERGVTVSIAPGLGQPRPHRRGEARGLHVYEFDDTRLRIHTYTWRDGGWALTAERTFARGSEPLSLGSTRRAGEATALRKAAVQVEEENRADERAEEADRVADQEPEDDAADNRSADA